MHLTYLHRIIATHTELVSVGMAAASWRGHRLTMGWVADLLRPRLSVHVHLGAMGRAAPASLIGIATTRQIR